MLVAVDLGFDTGTCLGLCLSIGMVWVTIYVLVWVKILAWMWVQVVQEIGLHLDKRPYFFLLKLLSIYGWLSVLVY